MPVINQVRISVVEKSFKNKEIITKKPHIDMSAFARTVN